MIPLIPTLALSLFSFLCSASIIVFTVVPLIPNNRVHPRKRTHKTRLALSQPEKAHLWLSALDIVLVAVFAWEVLDEHLIHHTDLDVVEEPASSVRLQLVLTLRQTCLFVISAITLLQIRNAKASSFGCFHVLVWLPVLAIAVVSASVSGVMSSVGIRSFRIGTTAYLLTISSLTTLAMVYLVSILKSIGRNLAAFYEIDESWQDAIGEISSCYSFTPADVEELKEGSSWITSDAESSFRDQISSFSFDSTEGFPTAKDHHASSAETQHDNSWLTEPSTLPPTMTDWSFPTTSANSHVPPSTTADAHAMLRDRHVCSCPATPAITPTQTKTLTGYNQRSTVGRDEEMGFRCSRRAIPRGLDISWKRISGWLGFVWIPSIFGLTSLLCDISRDPMSILFILSATTPALILAFNVILSPFPIPSDLFGNLSSLPKPSEVESRHKFSGSITVVEGRRSGDVWLSKGDAIYGKGRISRATSMLSRVPKLSVLPVKPTGPQEHACRKAAHCSPQYNSAAISTFVAIESCNANEMGWLAHSDGRDGDRTESLQSSLSDAQSRLARNCSSTTSRPNMIPATVSRRSSTGSRSSRGSRPYRGVFTTDLETILDVSMNASPSHERFQPSSNEPQQTAFNAVYSSNDVRTSRWLDRSRQDLITSSPPLTSIERQEEIDGLSAQVLPLLVPGLRIQPAVTNRETPTNIPPRLDSSLSFLSPELLSRSSSVNSGRRSVRYIPDAGSSCQAQTASRDARRHVSTHVNSGTKQDASNLKAPPSDVEFMPKEHKTRIPRGVEAQNSSKIPSVVDEDFCRVRLDNIVSPPSYCEDAHGQHRPSLIPVPVRLRGATVVYDSDRTTPSRDTREQSHDSEPQTTSVCLPSEAARSASDKRGTTLRGGQR